MRPALFLFAALTCLAADLAHSIDTLVDSSPHAMRSNIGIQVTDLKTGKALYARNENRFFLPASNMKLFTTALALQKLGPEYRFETRLIQEAGGDVVLVGSGDPSLSGRSYPYNSPEPAGPPLRAIEDLADQAVAAGLKRVQGDVVGDDRLYPWAPYPPNWSQDDVLGESGRSGERADRGRQRDRGDHRAGRQTRRLGQLFLSRRHSSIFPSIIASRL